MENDDTIQDVVSGGESIEQPIAEPTPQEAPEPKGEGLSNREALQRAISEKREPATIGEEKKEALTDTSTKAEIKEAVAESPEPPSEFNNQEKDAWKKGDVNGIQKAFKRLSDSRTKEITRAQKAEREALEKARPWQRLGEVAEPYIKAQGDLGITPDQALINALALVNAMKAENKNPAVIKAELKKNGIDLDAEGSTAPDQSKIDTLQKTVDALVEEREAQVYTQVRGVFANAFEKLATQKTRTGEPVFPDLFDASESGQKFAADIGSLTKDPRFVQGVTRRFPDADHSVLIREAYKYLGGRVSGEAVTVSTNDQKHVEKSRRAAASTPGRVATRNESSNLVGKLSNRAALARALAESREH